MDYPERRKQDARLIILKELVQEASYSLNETLAQALLEAFSINEPRAWVREQFKAMEDVDAVTLSKVGTVMIAAITKSGINHLERRAVLEGITRPSPEQ